MENKNALKDLGLNDYESSAHSTRVNKKIVDSQDLSRKSAIPAGEIYEGISDHE